MFDRLLANLTFSTAVLCLLVACTSQVNKDTDNNTAKPNQNADASSVALEEVMVTAQKRAYSVPRARTEQGMAMLAMPSMIMPIPPPQIQNRDNFAHYDKNPLKRVSDEPISTFSIDVDTAAYSTMRSFINQGQLPPKDAIRLEELVNYFDYAYAAPDDKAFLVTSEIARSPWNKNTHLLHIGIQGKRTDSKDLPPSNLVFLIDVSGSMHSPNKLPLVKKSLRLLAKDMRAQDSVALVVYAGAAGVVLEPTSGNDKAKIIAALEQLQAGGSTNGEQGIKLAYAIAASAFKQGGINRVILASDGDLNVGMSDTASLIQLIENKRKAGIELTTLGFGQGNYNSELMEQLADTGNGNHAYIDNLLEAQKVLVEQRAGTLFTIAKDVKIQIEFSPLVSEYRLLGYENRRLANEDFINDKVDAGEIGAGHSVTALYEITLSSAASQYLPQRRYQQTKTQAVTTDELAFVKIRHKKPGAQQSTEQQFVIKQQQIIDSLEATSDAFRFSAAVAAFAQNLSDNKYLGDFSYPQILTLAQQARGNDDLGYRAEFMGLVRLSQSLDDSGLNP